jgi:transposase, IS5 family
VAVRAERTVTAVLNICTQNPARRDEIAVFKGLALQALDNLSGDQAEYQRRERLSFMRFVGLGLEDAVAGAKTL